MAWLRSLRSSIKVIYALGQLVLLVTVLIAFYLFNYFIYFEPIQQSTGQPIRSYACTINIINLMIVIIGIISAISQHVPTLKGVSQSGCLKIVQFDGSQMLTSLSGCLVLRARHRKRILGNRLHVLDLVRRRIFEKYKPLYRGVTEQFHPLRLETNTCQRCSA